MYVFVLLLELRKSRTIRSIHCVMNRYQSPTFVLISRLLVPPEPYDRAHSEAMTWCRVRNGHGLKLIARLLDSLLTQTRVELKCECGGKGRGCAGDSVGSWRRRSRHVELRHGVECGGHGLEFVQGLERCRRLCGRRKKKKKRKTNKKRRVTEPGIEVSLCGLATSWKTREEKYAAISTHLHPECFSEDLPKLLRINGLYRWPRQPRRNKRLPDLLIHFLFFFFRYALKNRDSPVHRE